MEPVDLVGLLLEVFLVNTAMSGRGMTLESEPFGEPLG